MVNMAEHRCELPVLYTIGHSNHDLAKFLELLRRHEIAAIADVRSHPYSRYNPQFNRESLEPALARGRLEYVFLGEELGARRSEPECYAGDAVRYDLVAESALFRAGLDRLRRGMANYRVALMCAEKDPLTCHRTILICRHLRADVAEIRHILEDGSSETNEAAERRLLALLKLPPRDLFRGEAEMIEQAYDLQGEKIAYVAAETL
jgi:uncharacterized protein (DUF488 family)